jgi:hypothetical protein
MTWSLSAGGHNSGDNAEREAVERELADKLSEILADPKYGASSASFSGNFVSGDLRTREGWIKKAGV